MTKPRLGFLGVGWIGRNRMEAMLATGAVEAAAICDPNTGAAEDAAAVAGGAAVLPSLEAMLDLDLDGLVIASPSALHAGQSIAALQRGVAVFCQKPLGRDAGEAAATVAAARAADRLLGVDLSYRFTAGMVAIRDAIRAGELGHVFAADLVFHNAYGPDKPWFYDRAQSGGGCVMDLGVHLLDLALWALDYPAVTAVSSRLFAGGERLAPGTQAVEDFAEAQVDLATGATLRLACSWRLPIGADAAISASFRGTGGGATLRNMDGGFATFAAARHAGTASWDLGEPDSGWSGGAAADWARRLAAGEGFDPAAEQLVDLAAGLDRIYAGC